MKTNFHTHTARCGHASGTDREYVEAAIAGGLSTLGFSDHALQVFPNGYVSGIRMKTTETASYVESILGLREEYKEKIDIKLGYEAEYYPDIFADFLALVKKYPCDYLILGQHFLHNENGAAYCGGIDREEQMKQYAKQVCDGMRTGYFSYLAHPDLVRFTEENKAVFAPYYEQIIACSLETGVPLEINLLGIRERRQYPSPIFWKLAGEMGARVVLGCDAHTPDIVVDLPSYEVALSMIDTYGLTLVEPMLRKIS